MTFHDIEFSAKPELEYPFKRGWAPEHGKPFEVSEGVFWLRMPIPFSLDHINLWLLRDGDGWTIVDSGVDQESCKAVWDIVFDEFCSPDQIKRIVITHFHMDHIGLASWLALKCDCPIYMTRGEFEHYHRVTTRTEAESRETALPYYRSLGFDEKTCEAILRFFKADDKPKEARVQPEQVTYIKPDDVLEINSKHWKIVCGNGHSPEHACLYNESDKVLISGDQSLPRISSNVSLYPGNDVQDPLGDWLSSCEMLRDLIPSNTLVLPSHQEPFRRNPARMQQMIDDHHEQLNLLRASLQKPLNAAGVRRIMFDRELDQTQKVLATGETMAHLRYLTERAEVSETLDQNSVAWFQMINFKTDPDDLAIEATR